MAPRKEDDAAWLEIDLHGLRPGDALRRLGQQLHAARMLGESRVKVITGRGWGNREQKPILLPKVEAWLAGADGRRYGVMQYDRVDKDGALLVRLIRPDARG